MNKIDILRAMIADYEANYVYIKNYDGTNSNISNSKEYLLVQILKAILQDLEQLKREME